MIAIEYKNLSEATLVEFLQGLQITSICSPRLAPFEWSGHTQGFIDHHLSIFPEVVVIKN